MLYTFVSHFGQTHVLQKFLDIISDVANICLVLGFRCGDRNTLDERECNVVNAWEALNFAATL